MLEVSNIDVYHGDLQALHQVSVTVKDREIVALVGSNGAGKSTFLHTVSGLLRPARGAVRFDDLNTAELPVHKIVEAGICMVPEERRVFREMSVRENLEMGAFTARARQNKEATLSWVHEIFPILKQRERQLAGTLSGGEQQMVLIGRALMSQPKLLLIDELSSGLSPLLTQNLLKTIRDLHETTDMSIILIEQNVRKALELADRGYVIENGRIMVEGAARDLLDNRGVKDAYFGVAC